MNEHSRTRAGRTLAAVAIAMLLGGMGCAARTPAVTRSDTAISDDVRARLAADAQTKPYAITVETTDGVVRVSGGVAKDSERQQVEAVALATPGVQSVDNDVRYGVVRPAAEPDGE